MSEEQQISEKCCEEEMFEEEEQFENERTRNDEYLISVKLVAQNKTEEAQIERRCGLHIKLLSLSADNKSCSKHIIEMCFGRELENKFVIGRLIPGVVETLQVDIDIPPRQHDQIVVFILTGEDGKQCGDIDLVGTMYVEQSDDDSQGDHSCEPGECGGNCCCCPHANEVNEKMVKETEDDVIRTIQQQKQELMASREEVKFETMQAQKPINPFSDKKEEAKKQPVDQPQKQDWKSFKGIRYIDKKIGNGPLAVIGRRVTVDYCLRLNNESGKIIEKSDKAFKFMLGKGEVISGWDLGVPGMKVGGRRVLIIPAHLGYGKQAAGKIPPNSTLCFDIELHEVK